MAIIVGLEQSRMSRPHERKDQDLALGVSCFPGWMNTWEKKEKSYRSNHVFHEFRGHEKSLHYPENAKQLPTGYFIIITIDVGHH